MIDTIRTILAWSILLIAFPFLIIGAGIAWLAWQVVGSEKSSSEQGEEDF